MHRAKGLARRPVSLWLAWRWIGTERVPILDQVGRLIIEPSMARLEDRMREMNLTAREYRAKEFKIASGW